MLNTNQLREALSKHQITGHYFEDVYAVDTLPTLKRGKAYIMNTDPIHKPGEHWVALFRREDGRVIYMDSIGLNPPKMLTRYKITKTFNNRVQGVQPICGLYCMLFILSICRPNVLDILDKDCISNDGIVKMYVDREFDVRR